MAGRELRVDLVANARPFNNALDQAINKVKGFGDRTRALGGGSLGKGLAIGAGVAGFNLLTSAISAGVSQLDEMHQAYLDDQASQERLQNVLKNTEADYVAAAAAAEKFANAQIDLGFQDDDVRDSLGKLRGVTNSLEEAEKDVGLAMDIARAKNVSLETATQAVIQAVNGQSRGMRSLGIDTRGAANATELLAAATQNVKNAAVNYAKTAPGLVAKSNAKMSESVEKVGAAIDAVSQIAIPVMQTGLSTLVDIAGNIIGIFSHAADVLNQEFGPAIAFVGDLVRNALTPFAILNDIVNNIGGAIDAISGGGGATAKGGVTSTTTGGVTSTHYGPGSGAKFHDGGIVPGPYGSDQLIMAQAGERIVPTGQSAAGQTIIVNIASFIGSDRDIDRFSDRLAFRLRSTSLS